MSWLSCCTASRPFVSRALQWVWFRKPHGIPHGVCFEADTMFQYSFKILPDRLKLIRLYPCGSLRQSISFVFGARVGHFAATPQSDVVGIWSRDLGVMSTLSIRQKMPFFRAFITLRSQFHLHHCSQRALTEIDQKSPLTLDLSFKRLENWHGHWTILQHPSSLFLLCSFSSHCELVHLDL